MELKKGEEEDQEAVKHEVNNYLKRVLTSIEASIHEYPSRQWKASILFQKQDSFEHVLEQVARVLQEKEGRHIDKRYLQFYVNKDKRTRTRSENESGGDTAALMLFDRKANSNIDQLLTDSNCLYYKIAALSAEELEGMYRIQYWRYNIYFKRMGKSEEIDVIRGGTVEELLTMLITES